MGVGLTWLMVKTVFLPDHSIAAFPHFFRTLYLAQGVPRAQRGKKNNYVLQNVYDISQNLIGYGGFRKHPSLSKTQTCEDVELTVSRNCDPPFSLMAHCSFSMGPVDPSVQHIKKLHYVHLVWSHLWEPFGNDHNLTISMVRYFWLCSRQEKFTFKPGKLWSPENFSNCYCVARKKPIGCVKLNHKQEH